MKDVDVDIDIDRDVDIIHKCAALNKLLPFLVTAAAALNIILAVEFSPTEAATFCFLPHRLFGPHLLTIPGLVCSRQRI